MIVSLPLAILYAPAAAGAAPPSAPYNALVLDVGPGHDGVTGSMVFDNNNATFGAAHPWPDGLLLDAQSPPRYRSVAIIPPLGSAFVAGTTYTTFNQRTEDYAILSIWGGSWICYPHREGSLTVHSVTRDAGGLIDSFAASFSVACGDRSDAMKGEIRFRSNLGYLASAAEPSRLDFGQREVGSAGVARTTTFTAMGTAPSVFGQARIGGPHSSGFTKSADGCSGVTLHYGQTCSITVTGLATGLGKQEAYLILPDNSIGEQQHALLSIEGKDPRAVTLSTRSIDFGSMDYGRDGPARTIEVRAVGSQSVTFTAATLGGTTPSAFSVTGDTCANQTVPSGQSCTVTITPHPTAIGTQPATVSLHNNSLTPTETVQLSVTGGLGNIGTYYPLTPHRILDTRQSASPLGPGSIRSLEVVGSGVPGVGVSAVVLNVTVTAPTTGGHLTVYPSGVSRPNASSVNFTPGWTGANSVTVGVGADGKVNFYNSAGTTHLVVDVVGYYAAGNEFIGSLGRGGEFQPTVPERLFDSRVDWGETLCGNCYATIPVSYGSLLNPHIKALAVNITAVFPDAAGYLSAWNGNAIPSIPLTSTLNYRRGDIVSNMAIVPVCLGCWTGNNYPTIGVYSNQDTHVVVDIVGFYDDGQLGDGLRFNPMTPTRITDTRTGLGLPGALGQSVTGKITPSAGVLPTGTQALALNVTAVQPSVNTFITVWPHGIVGIDQPLVSNLNPAAGAIVPNAAYTLLGPANAFNVYNNAGSTHLVVDVVGTFYQYPAVPSGLLRHSGAGTGPGRELQRDAAAPAATRHSTS